MGFDIDIEFIKDVLLIALCAASAVYCWMLSHRLKRLNDLKSGVGASIVTLTEAIERTHSAATTARGELFEAMEEIKTLLDDAQTKSERLEVAMDRADTKILETQRAASAMNELIEVEVPEARRKALKTTEGLLKVMSDMKRLEAGLSGGPVRAVPAAADAVSDTTSRRAHDPAPARRGRGAA
ncbi:MAG: hypothetical protein AAF311_07950 [Pseudomonadota bacterium]